MTLQHVLRPATFQSTAAVIAGMLVGGAAWAATGSHVVSQAGREFRPTDITIKRGEVVQILNDDADLLHHPYVDSDRLQFDSGDQKPGSQTNITFPAAGTFAVLCAIHPKMKLNVYVK